MQKNTQLCFYWKAKSSSYEFALEEFIFVVGSAANSVDTTLEFTAFGSGPDAKHNSASAFCLFLSTTMVSAAARTHFPRKNTRLYRNTVTSNSRNIESGRSTSLELAAFGNGLEFKHSRASAFQYFLSTITVFAAVRTHFPKKNTRVYVNRAAINNQLFKAAGEEKRHQYSFI